MDLRSPATTYLFCDHHKKIFTVTVKVVIYERQFVISYNILLEKYLCSSRFYFNFIVGTGIL